jgi:hypothetical protein
MNQSQKKYLVKRLGRVAVEKAIDFAKNLGLTVDCDYHIKRAVENGQDLDDYVFNEKADFSALTLKDLKSPSQILAAAKEGAYDCGDDPQLNINFNDLFKDGSYKKVKNPSIKTAVKKVNGHITKIRKEMQRIEDELILGDCEKAQEMIQAFENF